MSTNTPVTPKAGKLPSKLVVDPGTPDVDEEIIEVEEIESPVIVAPIEAKKQDPARAEKSVVFQSLHKSPMFFITPTQYIRFTSGFFRTDVIIEIDFLRDCKQNGEEFWEGKLPDWVIAKKKKDKDMLSYVDEEEETKQ